MNWKWNNLLIFHKQNQQHYWLGLQNILGLLKENQKISLGYFLIGQSTTNKKIHPHLLIPDLMILLLKSAQLKIWTDFMRANYSILAFEEDHCMSIDLCLCLYYTFTEIYIYTSTLSHYDCSMCIRVLMKCLLLQKIPLPNFSFPFNFFLKAGILPPPTLVLMFITYLLIFRCLSHLLLSSQLRFNSLHSKILKTSQNVMYRVSLRYTEKHCNAGESKTYAGCSTQFTKEL